MRKDLKHHSHDIWPDSDEQAEQRAALYLNDDPLPDIPEALLGSASFADYARITGMIYPFNALDRKTGKFKEGLVKPASYEVKLIDVPLPPNTQKDFNKFFMEASGGQPIRSSIPTAVQTAEDRAELAMQKVDRLEREIRTISIAGVIAIILAVASIIIPILDIIESVVERP